MGKTTMESAREMVMQEVRKHFKHELLNRLDEIVVFDPLSHDELRKVCCLQKDVVSRLADRAIVLGVTETALDVILAGSYDPVYGARPMRRWLEKRVVTELSKMYIDASLDGKELTYRIEKNAGLVNAATGEKSDILIQLQSRPESDAVQVVKRMKVEEVDDADEIDE